MTAGYSGTPLPKKLGIREGSRVALLHAPEGFCATLGAVPSRVTVRDKVGSEADVIVLFATKFSKLKPEFLKAMRMMPADGGMLWIAWPKKAAKMDTDLDENFIRDYGLSLGVVDTKVCAIDETWSGLRFNRRRA
ncbi:MAG TPA: DUF3052 domain-containing protein [Gemmatimonadaceae bacterium]|jgi:hypothetical protein|nr:DUF3052 domain-containing protein [Gemmatimonadaceae bacterium]